MSQPQRLHWWASPQTVMRHLLMLDDTRHSIALGTMVGMFIGLTPTGGIQMLLVLGFAYLMRDVFRFNSVAALLTVYVSNPLTVLPIFWLDYQVGAFFFPHTASWQSIVAHLGPNSDLGWLEQIRWLYWTVGAPFIAGSLIVAAAGAAITYPAMRLLLSAFHWNRPLQTEAREEPAMAIRD